MTRKITKKEGKAYLRRWRLVNRFLLLELRKAPFQKKFRQLLTLYAARSLFSPRQKVVGDHWTRLRRKMGYV